MIGIARSNSFWATSSQLYSMDVDTSNKSPPSTSVKTSMITSFFKPKTPKSPSETTPDGSSHLKPHLDLVTNEDLKQGDYSQLQSSANGVENHDCMQKRDDGRRGQKCIRVTKDAASTGLQPGKATKKANEVGCCVKKDKVKPGKKDCNGRTDHPEQLCTEAKLEDSLSTSNHERSKCGKTSFLGKDQKSTGCFRSEEKHSKKRKKVSEFDSSSEDFETDKRTKIPKNEPLESDLLQEHTFDMNPLLGSAVNHDASGYCSDNDIFKVDENSDDVTEISFEDFLGESMEQNREKNIFGHVENQDENKGGQLTDTEVTGFGVFREIKSVSACPSQKTTKHAPSNTANANILGNTCTRRSSKQNMKKTADRSCTSAEISDGARCVKPSNSQTKSEHAPASCLADDSVLTISYSEFLQENATCDKQDKLQLSHPKQKRLTIEAEVHTPPQCQQTADSLITDLCHSPESHNSVVTTKRTSNVVVDLTDLDLTIVNTDQAPSESKNSKAVYSIFQKGPKDRSKESDSKSLKKSEQIKLANPSREGKSKHGQQRKPKVTDTSPEIISGSSPKMVDVERGQFKTKNRKRVGKSQKKILGTKSEEENTEEEFEDGKGKKNKNVVKKREIKIKKLGNITSLGREHAKNESLKSVQQTDAVVMTSTPKAILVKNMKAQKLLQRAKSRHVSQASRLSRQADDSKRVCHWTVTKTAPETAKKSAKRTSQDQDYESGNQRRPQRDLTSVLGRKLQPKERVNDDKVETNIRTLAAKKKMAVVEDIQARKATKLAPMFTKEGRLALAKKQQLSEAINSDSACVEILSDDDEASRDSIRSDRSGDKGCDVFVRSRELDAEQSYPPFPTISHVRQISPETEGSMDWWHLPGFSSFGKFLVKKERSGAVHNKDITVRDHLMRLGDFTSCLEDKSNVTKQFTCHPELSYDIQRLILDRIKAANPRFPVNRVFKRYLAKRKGESVLPKTSQVISTAEETASKAQCSSRKDSAFTKLKGERPSSAKRKSESTVPQNTKRRRVTLQEGSGLGAEKAEIEIHSKDRSRRRSSRGAARDEQSEEKQAVEPLMPRRSSRQLEKAAMQEVGSKETKEIKTVRLRRSKNACKNDGRTESKGSGGVVITKTTETRADKLASLAWTDKYQPTTSAEVIGNVQAMKRLVGWLTEWKKKTVRIKKKMKKRQGKQTNKTSLEVPVEDSDSDFAFYSDASCSNSDDDDDDTLSNAMLIVGPTGCGKTAAVYACAKELGFKIFEVNASSKRTGKQILADLGEATQSHHLSTHCRSGSNSALRSFLQAKSPPGTHTVKPQAKKTPIPKAFAAFYKAGADAAKQDRKKTKAPAGKTPKKSPLRPTAPATKTFKIGQPHHPPNTSKSDDGVATQRLTSTSLILFEDVDVVFDEDKGFLSGVSTFLKTTKRPIVLTTSDERFPEIFDEKYEMVKFRRPPNSLLSTHLQLLCLAENVYASHSDLQRLVSFLDCDVRRCWLAAQFWVSSGAGKFSPLPQKARGSKGNYRSFEALVEGKSTTLPQSFDSKVIVSKDDKEPSSLPSVESGFFENVAGLCSLTRVGSDIFSVLKDHSNVSCLQDKSAIAETLQREDGTFVYFSNIEELLPSVQRQLHRHTLENCATDQSRTESQPCGRSGSRSVHQALVAQMATFADDISLLDSCTLSPVHDGKRLGTQGWWYPSVKPTLALDLSTKDNRDFTRHATGCAIRGFLEAASFERCHRNWDGTFEWFRISHHAPSDDECQTDLKTGESTNDRETIAVHVKSRDDVGGSLKLGESTLTKCPELYPVLAEKLALCTHCNHRAFALDYLPMLRCVCRSEQFREETKMKRRFLHYLDSIAINLKKPDQIALCSVMDVRQQKQRDDAGNTTE